MNDLIGLTLKEIVNVQGFTNTDHVNCKSSCEKTYKFDESSLPLAFLRSTHE